MVAIWFMEWQIVRALVALSHAAHRITAAAEIAALKLAAASIKRASGFAERVQ